MKGLFSTLSVPMPGARGKALQELALAFIHVRAFAALRVYLYSGKGQLELMPYFLRVTPERPAPFVSGLRLESRD